MRIALLLLLTAFLQLTCLGQKAKPEPLDAWDSLRLQHQQVKEAFEQQLRKEFGRTDSVVTKDSILISSFLQDGRLLRQVAYALDSTGCPFWVCCQYYNGTEQLVYTIRHTLTCPARKADPYFHRLHYERFSYDEQGRLVLYIDTWADRPYRREFAYDADGKQVVRSIRKIAETHFWR